MNLRPVFTLVRDRVSAIVNGITTVPLADTALFNSSFQNYDSLLILINKTAGGTASGTVNIYIEDSWDGGVTWDDLVSSVQIALGAAAATQRFWVQGRIAPAVHTAGASTLSTQGSAAAAETLAAGSARQGPFGDRLRVREVVAGVSGSPVGCTYTITIIPCRSEDQ